VGSCRIHGTAAWADDACEACLDEVQPTPDRPAFAVALTFRVDGLPTPQGNKTAIVRDGKARLIEGRRPKARKQFADWRAAVAKRGRTVMAERERAPRGTPLTVEYWFFLPRPKTTPRSRWAPSVRPDLDKLERAVNDALTGVVFDDDSQIVDSHTHKRYSDEPTAYLLVTVHGIGWAAA
jgi:crossover junction endodeoxyribonuclease RusA